MPAVLAIHAPFGVLAVAGARTIAAVGVQLVSGVQLQHKLAAAELEHKVAVELVQRIAVAVVGQQQRRRQQQEPVAVGQQLEPVVADRQQQRRRHWGQQWPECLGQC